MVKKTGKPSPTTEELEKQKERAEERVLFAKYITDPSAVNEETLVERFRPLVYRIVHRFRYSPDQFEDLVQVGTMGLVLAIRRFDLDREYRFSTYAWQTIQGEIQRYFRDKTWAVNVPRDLKEKSLKVFNAISEISTGTGQEPTIQEVAQYTGYSEELVQEALELGSAYHPQSFQPATRESDFTMTLGSEESNEGTKQSLGSTKKHVFWDSMLNYLAEAEAEVIRMYYFEQRTQKEISEHLATSQMNVSRIMRKALGKLRSLMAPEDVDKLSAP